jgi:hypothetical protein
VSRMRRHASICAFAALGLAFCQPAEPPPVSPPKPTDPTSLAQLGPAVVIDASIVTEGGTGWDGAGFELDTGATLGRAASP